MSLLLWSTSIVLPSLVAYRLPPMLSRLSAPSLATRSTFPSSPYRFLASSRASAQRFCLARTVFPLFCASQARLFRPAPTVLPHCRALFALRSRSSVRFPVASCVTRSRLFPSIPSPVLFPVALFALIAFFFGRVLLYSTNNFALLRFATQTVTLGFVYCVCSLLLMK